MEKRIIKIAPDDAGKRIDACLAEKFKDDFSRCQVKRFIDEGHCLCDGKFRKAHYKLLGNEVIEISIPLQGDPVVEPEEMPLDIVYEDDDIIVVNKPSDLVVHPAPGNPNQTLVNALLFHTKGKLAYRGTSSRPGIVHRLDKEVSGLLVAAKTEKASKALVGDFKTKTIRRRYIAFVDGIVAREEGISDLPIGRARHDRKKMVVRFTNSKQALTRFKVLKRYSNYTKLEIELETGRTHQIRVHMSHMKHPVIGDTKYGGGKYRRIALYAAELMFKHPLTGKPLHFKVDMPMDLRSLEEGMYK